MGRERDILEHAVHTVAEQAAKADDLVDEAAAAGGGSHPVTIHAKMLRLELLNVKADLERELEDFVPNCKKCGLDVHWVAGLGITPGHWAHREPATHAEPSVEPCDVIAKALFQGAGLTSAAAGGDEARLDRLTYGQPIRRQGMSLLDEIQADATGVDVPIEVLLRKVLILATRLEHEPMKGWVHHELDGYPDDAELPPSAPATRPS
jgi:AbiTii